MGFPTTWFLGLALRLALDQRIGEEAAQVQFWTKALRELTCFYFPSIFLLMLLPAAWEELPLGSAYSELTHVGETRAQPIARNQSQWTYSLKGGLLAELKLVHLSPRQTNGVWEINAYCEHWNICDCSYAAIAGWYSGSISSSTVIIFLAPMLNLWGAYCSNKAKTREALLTSTQQQGTTHTKKNLEVLRDQHHLKYTLLIWNVTRDFSHSSFYLGEMLRWVIWM